MAGNENSGRKKGGETFEIRFKMPIQFEKPLQDKSDELGVGLNQGAKSLIIESLKQK